MKTSEEDGLKAKFDELEANLANQTGMKFEINNLIDSLQEKNKQDYLKSLKEEPVPITEGV